MSESTEAVVSIAGNESVADAACPTCAARSQTRSPAGFVYAIGRIEPRFPNLAVEKEFAQVIGRTDTAGQTDRQVMHDLLSKRENRYLARQLCWVFTVNGLEVYLLLPRDALDFELLVEAIGPTQEPDDIDVVIGTRGPLAPPEMCNGLMVPLAVVDQIYSFRRKALLQAIPHPEDVDRSQFQSAASELFERVLGMTDNAGASDEHRALNYLAMRYPAIYAHTATRLQSDYALTGVETRPYPLANARRIVEVIFRYGNRKSDFSEKFVVRVDVTEEFPFLFSKLSPFYDK
jgi:hypothetical protein